jgi:hypothetical protein
LLGATYKIKTPKSDHALYVTINNIEIGGVQHPFEIFINSKNMDQFQWVVAMTRVMSATFRKGGDVSFLVEEMKSVFDPAGGYFKKGGRYMNSTVAEIGYIIEEHLQSTGHIVIEEIPEHVKAILEDKKEQAGGLGNASVCRKCGEKAVVLMDGCFCCTACGDSKCG